MYDFLIIHKKYPDASYLDIFMGIFPPKKTFVMFAGVFLSQPTFSTQNKMQFQNFEFLAKNSCFELENIAHLFHLQIAIIF